MYMQIVCLFTFYYMCTHVCIKVCVCACGKRNANYLLSEIQRWNVMWGWIPNQIGILCYHIFRLCLHMTSSK